jgi:GH18 family chitinase
LLSGALLIMLLSIAAAGQNKWFTTYYSTWSMLPLGSSNLALPPWEIDWTGLTHVVLFDNGNVTQHPPYWAYMFGSIPTDSESDSVAVEFNGVAAPGTGKFTHYMDSLVAIAHRKGVKVVVTIQAVNPLNLNYVAADSARTQLFVNTVGSWAERKKFDGVELDWEGWASPLPPAAVVNRFVRMLYNRIHTMTTVGGAPGLIMISAGSGQQTLYDPAQDYMVDQFNLQLYDYAYAWYAKIGSNASWYISPLHKGTVDPTFEGEAYDTRGPLQWVDAGHSPQRIGLGIPAFGYILRNVDGLFQPMANPDYGNAHYQVIEALKSNGGVEEWDDARKVRSIHGTALRNAGSVYYGSDGINAGQKFFATGENPQSLGEKIQWMNANNFGGVMTYEFVSDLDYTQSIVSGRRNPLQRSIATALGSPPPPLVAPPTGSFTGSVSTLPAGGGTVTLAWTSFDAVSASIDQGVGTVPLNGSRSVFVASTRIFTLTLVNADHATMSYNVRVDVDTAVVQTVKLAQGWNMVSSYVRPYVPLLSSVCRDILASGCVVKNGAGNVYWPALSISAITSWEALLGYLVYTETEQVLTLTGTLIDPAQTPIELQSGMNLVPYLRTSPLPPEAAFASVMDSLIIVFDGMGRIYWPAKNVYTLTSIAPGSGYFVYVPGPARLVYPANTSPAGSVGAKRGG